MAKKINNEETHRNMEDLAMKTVAEQETGGTRDETAQSEEKETGEAQEQSNGQQPQETSDPHMLDLLKRFPCYPALYIGNGGSVFSPDTAVHIRKQAALYKNPYFKQPKMQS